ncbi:MAG TPA: flagellar biosynthesis protein FlhB [Pseudomonadales bacterium]
MAEENLGQERTERATPRKREKAREEGQVPRSRELNSMALVCAAALGLMGLAPWGAGRLMELTRRLFDLASQPEAHWMEALGTAAVETARVLAPFLLLTALAGVASSVAVGGFLLSGKAVSFKASRLSPMNGFKRMFSVRALVELVKSVVKIVVIAGVAVLLLHAVMGDLLHIASLTLESAIGSGLHIVLVALLLMGAVLVLIAAIDVPFQIHQHEKQLRMTLQEVKDEMKDTEGKPEVRSRIRQLQYEMSRRRMLEEVPKADVVITNPEHFSVAIKYDALSMSAPVVLAKGADRMAFRIREIAEAADVPMLRVPALARAVYYATEPGEEIPPGLYVAVAQVLAYVYQLEQYRRGQLARAPELGDVTVPPDYYVEGEA